jgi:quinol monooxygenase YgiN
VPSHEAGVTHRCVGEVRADPERSRRPVSCERPTSRDAFCHAEVVKSRWKSLSELDADTHYVVLASSIPPKSMASTWSMFRGSRVVREQLLTTDGVLGFSMLAEPARKTYATLSVWRDEAALSAFATAEPHALLMAELAPLMDEPKFVRWTISGSDGVPSWSDALDRLHGERAHE